MRVHGRIFTPDLSSYTWVTVQTDPTGNNEYVYITWLIQVLKLVLGESPFYANYGIPAVQAVIQQIFPDWYVMQVQSQFQQFFTSLIISKVSNSEFPEYNVQLLTFSGTPFQGTIAT